MTVEISEYNGNPVITLKRTDNDNYPFRFGVRKAQLIIEHIEDIKKFVKTNSKWWLKNITFTKSTHTFVIFKYIKTSQHI